MIAGEALGVAARVETRTPIVYFDVLLQPGGTVLLASPAAFNTAVYVFEGIARISGERDAESGTFVVLGDGATLEWPDLANHCRARLADFKVPKQLIIRDSLPRNPSGKVLKRVLRAELETHA